jgi:ribonucleoside-diphosphate reductase alpha chain
VQQDLLTVTAEQPVPAPIAVSSATGDDGEQIVMGALNETLAGACPDCGSQLEYAEGCAKCHVCGFSECG